MTHHTERAEVADMPEAVLLLVAALLVLAVVIVTFEDALLRRRKAARVHAALRRLGEPVPADGRTAS